MQATDQKVAEVSTARELVTVTTVTYGLNDDEEEDTSAGVADPVDGGYAAAAAAAAFTRASIKKDLRNTPAKKLLAKVSRSLLPAAVSTPMAE